MEYDFREIEKKWQKQWAEMKTYQVTEDKSREKFYVLNMFPYPSGAGLHVGHPLGYIASDIYARYKRLMGYNVLNPMGYDAYGLPAEQYAIQTGQHPAITTAENISRYRSQLDKIGFSFDWNREVRTCEPKYYKWTQWAFQKMFNSFYCNTCQKAQPIEKLIEHFSQKGTEGLDVAQSEEMSFTAAEWNAMSEKEQQQVLMNYRIAYLGETMVNWCAGLGTVLANDEVVDGVSVRGGYPVVQKKMMQWCLRVSAYAQRLLDGLDTVDWTESLKETQRNWIGRSEGTEMQFKIAPSNSPRGGEQVSLVDETSIKNKWEQFKTANPFNYDILKEYAKENRKNSTDAENALWEALRNKQLGEKFRRQHVIGDFIADFISLSSKLVIEIDGDYHNEPEQKEADLLRTKFLNEIGFTVLRFTNEEVLGNTEDVINKIKEKITFKANQSSPTGGVEGAFTIFTTRADTIFGVTFMVLAPESELVEKLTTPEQKAEVDAYIERTKKRTERERISDRSVTGVFSGSYAINPFTGENIPIWISDYVLAASHLYGVVSLHDFELLLRHYEKNLDDFDGYAREEGSYRNTILFQPRYLGICTLQQLIGNTVPEVLTTMDGLFLHPSFTEDFQNEQKEMVKAFAKKGGQNVEEKDFDQFFASAGEKTSYRKLLRDTMDKPMYLPAKEEFLKYVNEDYHVISTAEKNLRNYLKGKYGKELEAAAQAAGKAFDEKEASRHAHAQVMLQAAKTDLAIRTGKATVHLEEAAAQDVRRQQAEEEARRKAEAEVQIQRRMEEAQKARAEAEARRLAEAQRAAEEAKREAAKKAEAQRIAEQEAAQQAEAQRLAEEAAQREQAQRAAEQEAAQRQRAAVSEEVSLNTQQLPPMEDHLSDMNPLEAISSAKLASAVQQEKVYTGMGEGTEIDEEKKLSGELAKIFRKYREMPGLESQLAAYFESLEQEMAISTSQIGNIIISGNSSSDKSDLARAIVRAVNYLYPEHTRKIAKTTGDSINNRGLAKAMNKLKGTALIVEGAGAIQPKRMSEMLECLEQDTERMIVILEDSDAEMNVLLNFNPEMTQKFNHRIVLKQYTVNELVEMARKFARKRQYEVSDDALLELYLKIDKLRNNVDNIRMDDIKEIINHAIVKAEKRGSKRFFGGLKRKRSENGDVTILVEADFKD